MKHVFICESCDKIHILEEGEKRFCETDGKPYLDTGLTEEEWNTKSDEEKEVLKKEVFKKSIDLDNIKEKAQHTLGNVVNATKKWDESIPNDFADKERLKVQGISLNLSEIIYLVGFVSVILGSILPYYSMLGKSMNLIAPTGSLGGGFIFFILAIAGIATIFFKQKIQWKYKSYILPGLALITILLGFITTGQINKTLQEISSLGSAFGLGKKMTSSLLQKGIGYYLFQLSRLVLIAGIILEAYKFYKQNASKTSK
ncbi:MULTISPECIES: hypothetical protein [Terrabacteria group]|uniref:hypothetical protein n=1 Tax=Bacillati TaxID=1783272 RepID=UPI001C6F2A1A|nr:MULTISPECIES: hypothetical protein [Terrabacteria group]MBW9212222.1 hypothetical protein [Trueperella sp. zg.1013]